VALAEAVAAVAAALDKATHAFVRVWRSTCGHIGLHGFGDGQVPMSHRLDSGQPGDF